MYIMFGEFLWWNSWKHKSVILCYIILYYIKFTELSTIIPSLSVRTQQQIWRWSFRHNHRRRGEWCLWQWHQFPDHRRLPGRRAGQTASGSAGCVSMSTNLVARHSKVGLYVVQLAVFWLLFRHVFVRRSQCMTPQLLLQTGLCIHSRAEMVTLNNFIHANNC